MASTQKTREQCLTDDSSKIKVTILAPEWGTTMSTKLALQLARFPEAEVTTFLPRCSEVDKNQAFKNNVTIVEATRRPGFGELQLLSFPPEHLQMDVIVGIGLELGRHAQVIKEFKRCKWVQVVDSDPEEITMLKSSSIPTSAAHEQHRTEVELCELADLVVGLGPKVCEVFRSYLRSCQKDQDVFDFTPGVSEEFLEVNQSPDEGKHRCVLVFGCGDEDDFELSGLAIAGKAVASLSNTRLVLAVASDRKNDTTVEKLKKCGLSPRCLRVRSCVQSEEELKRLFYEDDLLLMPSRTEGFGVRGLEALSAGLPVLVSMNSGFGEALSKVQFGSAFVVDSEDPKVWAAAVQGIWEKDRRSRLEEAEMLRTSYEKKYSWSTQCRNLLDKMISLVHESSNVTDCQKRVLGTKRRAEGQQDARVVEEAVKYLKSHKDDVQQGLAQKEDEKQVSATSGISCEIANCETDITFFANRHDESTRQWLFDDIYEWFSNPGDSKAYVLLGDAGVGKSVMAGALAQRMKMAGDLAAAYFCRYNDNTRNDPRNLLGTIASQLCDCNNEYNNIIGGKDGVKVMLANSTLGVLELCTKLLEEALGQCSPSQKRKLVIIDALDETEYKSREDFLCLIKERFPRLPKGLVFFITSRPEDTVQTRLERYKPCVRICAGSSNQNSFYRQHEQDIERFLVKNVDFSRLHFSAEDVRKKCNGLFLYAFYIAKELNDFTDAGDVNQSEVPFPGDIEDFFRTNLQRMYDKVGADLYAKLLGCILSAPSPLPVSIILYVIDREVSDIDKQEIIDAISQFVVLKEKATFLHQMIPMWLTDERKARKLYIDHEWAEVYFVGILYELVSFVNDSGPKDDKLVCDLKGFLRVLRKKKRKRSR